MSRFPHDNYVLESPPGAEVVISGRQYTYFAGTAYLGLQGHPEVIRAACEATQKYGICSATVRTGFGNNPPLLEVERAAAEFFAAEDAFYFLSGYLGNTILLRHLASRFEALYIDACAHYSMFEAARACGLPLHPFTHGDADNLAKQLRHHVQPSQRPIVLTDGVFPVLGTVAPLADYLAVLSKYEGAALLVDDAHGFGVLGECGRGTAEHHGIAPDELNSDGDARVFVCGTLSKALGGHGGIIAGSGALLESLKQQSTYYTGSTPPAAPAAAASAAAWRLVAAEPQRRRRLRDNIKQVRDGIRSLGFDLPDTPVPIIGLVIGEAANMKRVQRQLMEQGIVIAYMAAYSGVGAQGALRIAVCSEHTEPMIASLIRELRAVL